MNTTSKDPDKGRMYYAFHNTKEWLHTRLKALTNSKLFWGVVALLFFAVLWFRPDLQPYILILREYSFVIVMLLLIVAISIIFLKMRVKWLWSIPITMLIFTISFVYFGAQQYVALYLKYENLNQVELHQLPLSDKVMPQPLNSIHVLAKQRITETEDKAIPDIATPDRVLIGGTPHWSMEVTPDYSFSKFTGRVTELYLMDGTLPSPRFSKPNQVCFNVGEQLVSSKNSYTAAKKSLSPWKYLSYFPVNVKYLLDDTGEEVQVISLAKWEGIFFPTIEFGGVIVVRQNCDESFFSAWKRRLIGVGDYISPNEIQNYTYLKGQNLVPYKVYRYMANSFRFQAGFFGPLSIQHKGDIRIPDMPDDQNEQPFIQYFKEVGKNDLSGLFATFALEPYRETSQGSSLSLFIPGDVGNTAYYYNHAEKKETLIGSTAVSGILKNEKKDYVWGNTAKTVEAKTFIRDIAGKRRYYFLATIATSASKAVKASEENPEDIRSKSKMTISKDNLAGYYPELAIIDAALGSVTFIDVTKDVKYWDKQVAEKNARDYANE